MYIYIVYNLSKLVLLSHLVSYIVTLSCCGVLDFVRSTVNLAPEIVYFGLNVGEGLVECTFPISISHYPAFPLRDAFSGKEKLIDGICKSPIKRTMEKSLGLTLITSDVYLGTLC